MVGYGWIWLDMVGYGWIWLDMVGYGWIWLDMVGYGWIWLDMVGYGWIWLDMVGYGWIWLDMVGIYGKPRRGGGMVENDLFQYTKPRRGGGYYSRASAGSGGLCPSPLRGCVKIRIGFFLPCRHPSGIHKRHIYLQPYPTAQRAFSIYGLLRSAPVLPKPGGHRRRETGGAVPELHRGS